MIIPFHFHRQDSNPERERRLLHFADPDVPDAFKDDESLRKAEALQDNPEFNKINVGLAEFGRQKEYSFLNEQAENRDFHRSMIMSLIFAEAGPAVQGKDLDNLKGRNLDSFNAINRETFLKQFTGDTKTVLSKAEDFGIPLERITAIQNEELSALDPTSKANSIIQSNILKNAIFEAWLETFMLDFAKAATEKGKKTKTEDIFRTADSLSGAEGNVGSLEITLLRYKRVFSEVTLAFGKPPRGEEIFKKLPKVIQTRLIYESWYSGGKPLIDNIAVFGDQLGGARLADTFTALDTYFSTPDVIAPNPEARSWLSQQASACSYLLMIFQKLPSGSVPKAVSAMVEKMAKEQPVTDGEKKAIITLLKVLAVTAVPQKTRGISRIRSGQVPIDTKLPGNLEKAAGIKETVERVEDPTKLVEQYTGLEPGDIQTLSAAYNAADLPVVKDAASWRSNPAAALEFLSGVRNAEFQANIQGFLSKLKAYVAGNKEHEAIILNALGALGEDLVTRDVILSRSAEQRKELSILGTMKEMVSKGSTDFMKLARENPIAALILGVVIFKAGKFVLFSDKNAARLSRWVIGGGVASLYVIEKYNPMGLKDIVDNRMRGDRFAGTIERYYAQNLKNEKGERTIEEDKDDMSHRAIQNIAQTKTGDLLKFYQETKRLKTGREKKRSGSKEVFARLRFPREMRDLKKSTTYEMDNEEMVDVYFPIIESMLARYSELRGGPENGATTRKSTGGFESKVADGYIKLKEDIEGLGLLTETRDKSKADVLRAYAMVVRHPDKYMSTSSSPEQQALDDVVANPSRCDPDLLAVEGVNSGEGLYNLAMDSIGKDVDYALSVATTLAKIDNDIATFRRSNIGVAVPFEVVLRMMVKPKDMEQYASQQGTSFRKYLRATGRGDGLLSRIYNRPLETAGELGDEALTQAGLAYDYVSGKFTSAVTATGKAIDTATKATTSTLKNAQIAVGTMINNAGEWLDKDGKTLVNDAIGEFGTAISTAYKWTGEKVYAAS
ncbi:MAG: hypothetical protein O2904_04940, partial [bacterium]|nr:hypothetical protein [bacterium]